MSKKRLIGIFVGQVEMPAQREFLQGVAREALKNNINVAVFSTLVQEGGYEAYQNGECFVFDIASLEKMDAVIIMPETLRLRPKLLEDLCERIRKVPNLLKVTFDREIPGFMPFLCDDVSASKHIVEHLIKIHGCRDIVYMTGKSGHPHSMARLEGYRLALQENGIEYDESKVYYGDFWYYKGNEVVESILAGRKRLPDAVACANEPMAISICEAFERHGIQVPEQVLVVGFDHSGDGIHSVDYTTSICREEEVKGHEIVRYILSQLGDSTALEPVVRPTPKVFIGKTCGCHAEKGVTIESEEEHTDVKKFFSIFNFMNERLIDSKTITEFLWEIDSSCYWLEDFKEFSVIVTEKCFFGSGESCKRENFLGNERVILAYKNDRAYKNDSPEAKESRVDFRRRFDKGIMHPDLWDEDKRAAVYIFNILHFNEEVFGYSVVTFNEEPFCCTSNYPFWIKNIDNAAEALRRQYGVRFLYHDAERKSITDTMTGLYNRNGFNRMITEKIEDMTDDDYLLLMEFDNNNLKKVNDNFGHEAGDEMILLSTQAIEKSRVANATYESNFRIGGDEYVKLAIGPIKPENADLAMNECEQFLENVTYVLDRPYPITLACGYSLYKKEDIHSVDEIMKVADTKMYKHKAEMKKCLDGII